MIFKENILKSVMIKFIQISLLTTFGFGQSLEFTFPDSTYNYTEEISSNHIINFSDNSIFNGSDFSFEYSGEDASWLNVTDDIYGANGDFWINFYGTADDEYFNDTLFTLIVTNNVTSESDTLDFIVNILAVNDEPVFVAIEFDTLYAVEEIEFNFELTFLDPDETPANEFFVNTEEDWYNQNVDIVKNGNEYTIEFSGIPDDIDLFDTDVSVQIVDEFGSNDTQNLNIQIQSINDTPQIIGQNPLFYLKNSQFQISLNDISYFDPDNSVEDFSINVFDGENFNFYNDFISSDTNFFGELNVDIQLNDGELENNLSDTFTVFIDIVISPEFITNSEETIEVNEDEEYSFVVNFDDEDTQSIQEFSIELGGSASNWLDLDYPFLDGNSFGLNISGNPNDINLDDTLLNIIVFDDFGLSDTIDFQFFINPVNDAPFIVGQNSKNSDEEDSFQIELTDLFISHPQNELENFELTIFEGEFYSVDSLQWITPDSNYFGNLEVQIQVSDGDTINSLSNIFDFQIEINPVNDEPVFVAIEFDTLYAVEEIEFYFELTFLDPDETPADDFNVNADEDWYNQNADIVKNGNEYTIEFTGIPDDIDLFDTDVSVQIVDEFGSNDTQNLNIQIQSINDEIPTFITEFTEQIIDEDAEFLYQIDFEDIDNHNPDNLIVEIFGPATSWLNYNENLSHDNDSYSFLLLGTPDDFNYDDDFAVVKVTDYDLTSVEDTISFQILSINDAPVEIITSDSDLDAAFGATNYTTTISFEDIDNHELFDYHIELTNVTLNNEIMENYLELGELEYENSSYQFSISGTLEENLSINYCEFDITITDEYNYINQSPENSNISNQSTKHFVLPILPNSAPIPEITLSDNTGLTGSQISLSSEFSLDINNDMHTYHWSALPVERKETFIDINGNGEFEENEPFYDLNNNGIFEPSFVQLIYSEIENSNSPNSVITIPETFENTELTVVLKIIDSKGAVGLTETIINTINPRLVLESVQGNQSEFTVMPIYFDNLLNEPIYSLDLEFRWNTQEFELGPEFGCSSMNYYPSVIGDSISINLPVMPLEFQYYVNDLEPGKLGVTIYSITGDSINTLIENNLSFAELNIPLTGFHNESDRVYVSKFAINEKNYGANSNLNLSNGVVTISGEKVEPLADFIVRDIDGVEFTENDFIYSGSELEFEIITICDDSESPISVCDSTGHNLLGNGLQPNYYWDFESDGTIDESGQLFGNVTNEYSYSITGFENIVKTATLNIETAYGCASNQFNIDVEPLIPTIRMARSGDGFDYDGEPASINLFINQMEDLEALDLVIDYDPTKISVIDVENQINIDEALNSGANYTLLHNSINSQIFITAYSDSLNNFTFFNENSDFQFASIKFYALQSGNTDISILSFNVDETSFLSNIGGNSLITIENVSPNEGEYDCNLNGVYDVDEEFTDSNGNGLYDEGEEFIDAGDLNGSAIIDQCGICSGGLTTNTPNATQDCRGTCMPSQYLENVDIEMSVDYIYADGDYYSLNCENLDEGFNIESLECEQYIGLESSHPLAEENGVDLCGLCGGNNIALDGQFIGSEIDCNGYCSESTPNASDQYGFCGCIDDNDGIYPDIDGLCKNGIEPIEETGLCSDVFDDVNMDGVWSPATDIIIEKIDTTTIDFSMWGYQYLNYDPIALNDDGSCSRGVVINEFFFSPVQGTAVPDFIELLNMTPFNIDISTWMINGIDLEEEYSGETPIMPAGKHFLISTGLPFYNIEGDRYFPGNCTEEMQPCYNIPNSIAININLGMNNGEILIEDYTTMDYLNYNEEAYWPVGAPFIGHSVELIEPYKNRNLSSNWLRASEHYPNPYMATEDGEWDVAGGYNYGTPGRSNDAYNEEHNCNENLDIECNPTKYDCDDVFNGLAYFDLCGICAGGSTENQPSIFDEELGYCTGDSAFIDCACTCSSEQNSNAVIDDCGQCTGGNAGSFHPNGLIVVDPIDFLNCEVDEDCSIWGMVCNQNTSYCHHDYNGHEDYCGTCRLGPECDGSNEDICDENFNSFEGFIDENLNGIYDLGEEFSDNNADGIWNDGLDDCGICTQNAVNIYTDTNEDNIISPCFDGEFDNDGNWISNCPDWESAVEAIGCSVDCLGDVEFNGTSNDINAGQDICGECILCSTDDCTEEPEWNSSCVYDFAVTTNMNIPGVQLDWVPMLDYDFYQIYKNDELLIDNLVITESHFIDEEVSYPNNYCYYITAYTEGGVYSNPSSIECASIDYFGNMTLDDFQINSNFNSARLSFNVSDEMDTILFQIADNVIVDSLKNELFEHNGYIVEKDLNSVKIYPNNPNYSLADSMVLGDIFFSRDTTGLNDSFCVDYVSFDPVYNAFFPYGFIAQLPECEYFGCTDMTAFNYNENATIDDGSCQSPHYVVEIEPTGFSQNITISSTTNFLEVGDEIGIYDENGIVSTECPAEYGELLVGTDLFLGETLTINAIRAIPCSPINPNNPAGLGFIPGNDIVIKVWRALTQQEFTFSVSEQGHFFSGNDITINQINIPLHYEVEIEETGNFQAIIFNENIEGLQYGDHIGIFDFSGISSVECPAVFDTVLVGSGYYMDEVLTVDAIRATPCSPFNPNDPAEPGFIVGNQIVIKIWRESEQTEYLMGTNDPQPTFGMGAIYINELLNNDIVILPNQYQLHPVFPNPFNPVATIQYDIPEIAYITIEVFNVLGKRVEVLHSGVQSPGAYEIKWNGSNQSSGLYLIRLSTDKFNFIEKVMLVK